MALTVRDGMRHAIYIGNPGDTIQVSESNCHRFPVQRTASMVYETKHHTHSASEVPIDDAKLWQWVEKWMERGMIAEGHMASADSKHWQGKF